MNDNTGREDVPLVPILRLPPLPVPNPTLRHDQTMQSFDEFKVLQHIRCEAFTILFRRSVEGIEDEELVLVVWEV